MLLPLVGAAVLRARAHASVAAWQQCYGVRTRDGRGQQFDGCERVNSGGTVLSFHVRV